MINLQEDGEEDAEDKHPAAEDHQPPDPLGGHSHGGQVGKVGVRPPAGLGGWGRVRN